ncbi:MAG TPA: SDR family oxidoreductase [Ktedonobacterales bacterium]|jgi:nucleoside-diphosphate-sugar epimerase|nr:SDR family oxidoreductase [Ktedonobacterales bacterium]
MRVFVTGATGHIGSLVVAELLQAGHQVVGLARSDTSAAGLAAMGAAVQLGTLDDVDRLRAGANVADGVIHLAFDHNFADHTSAVRMDLRAVETLGRALEGSGKPFVVTSGTLLLTYVLPSGRVGTEDDAAHGNPAAVSRIDSENLAIALAERGVRSSVVRLAPTVHGPADAHGFVPSLIRIARDKGFSAYVGDGSNCWPAVHERDAARLFRLALETAPAGSRLHGVGDEAIPFRTIAEIVGRHLNLPVVSIPRDEADAHFGFLGAIVSANNPTSSALTQERLGWRPTHPGLIADLEAGHYFNRTAA